VVVVEAVVIEFEGGFGWFGYVFQKKAVLRFI
jgi:hypothetical protein